MKITNIVLVIVITISGAFGLSLFFDKKKEIERQDLLVVGVASGYAPFVSVNNQGIYEGFDIDVAQALAQVMGKKLVLKDLGSMTGLFMALENGAIDIIMWGLSITKERLKKVAMVNYQGSATLAYPLLFWKEIPSSVKGIEDMVNMAVCVEPASSQELVLNKYPFINKVLVDRIDDALLNIQYGKADAALVEPAIAYKFKKKYPEIVAIDLMLAPEDQVDGVGIAIKKENTSLVKDIKASISYLKGTGFISASAEKWGIA